MSEPFLGEIRIFTYHYAPDNWAYCDGQLITVEQNPALYSILSNNYGGDGYYQFALPNLKGRAPMHAGRGMGLTSRVLSEKTGSPTANVDVNMMPAHSHTAFACVDTGDQQSPANNFISNGVNITEYKQIPYTQTAMNYDMVGVTGGDDGHYNMQPYLTLPFCIAMNGMYPPRN